MARKYSKKAGKKLYDKQSERDHRQLRIDKVGVRDLKFPIQVRDKARSVQNTVATIGMFVDLPKEFKGTHMSRFIEVLNIGAASVALLATVTMPWPVPLWFTLKTAGANAANGTENVAIAPFALVAVSTERQARHSPRATA